MSIPKLPTGTISQRVTLADDNTKNLFNQLRSYILSLGDDVIENQTKNDLNFIRNKWFACVRVGRKHILLRIGVNPESIEQELYDSKFFRHYMPRDPSHVSVKIKTVPDLEKAEPFINRAYNMK